MSSAGTSVLRLGRMVFQPFMTAGKWYNETAKRHPLGCGIVTTTIKTSMADIFAQKVLEGREELDWNRHAVFCTFGLTYLGAFQYWLYNVKFVQFCGPLTARVGHKAVAPVKVFLDQFVHHPLLYFPVFFTMKTLIQGKPLSAAVDKYQSDIWDSCKALWTVWVPLQLINFAFVPRHLRIPYVAGVSFLWCIILSVMQGKLDGQEAQDALAQAEAMMQQAAGDMGQEEQQQGTPLKPLVKPVGGPTFASSPVVATAAMHEPKLAAAVDAVARAECTAAREV